MNDQHFVYVLCCSDGSLYTGYTTDLERRLEEHQSGKAARYTRGRRPVTLLAHWTFPNRSAALKAELRFKKRSRDAKLAAIKEGELYIPIQPTP